MNAAVRDAALVHGGDERVVEARRRSPSVERLMSAFRLHNDQTYTPSAIVYRADAPETVSGPALIAFRNAMALSFVLRSWATETTNDEVLYSDSFDIFPAYPTDAGRLLIVTPATRSLFSTGAKFIATPSPIGRLSPSYLAQDYYIGRAAAECWCRCYQRGQNDRFSRSLFRSLEIAYAAASAPSRSNATEQEWGNNLALWVSAIEVLAHPRAHRRTGNVNRTEALNLLSPCRWGDKRLDRMRPRALPENKKKFSTPMNAIQFVYLHLHHARNKYLHGDATPRHIMFPFKRARETSLVMLAPLVYRTALFSYLRTKVRPYQGFTNAEWRNPRARPHLYPMVADRMRLNEALSRMLWPGRDDLR